MDAYKESFQRFEKKFLINEKQYQSILKYLETTAGPDQYGLTTIHNIYYDTRDFYLVRKSLEKPVYKEKLRLRTYGRPDGASPAFIEIKKKYQDIVYKRRISLPYDEAVNYLKTGQREKFTDYESEQIGREIDWFLRFRESIGPKMDICYERVAWAGISDPEFRVTFDSSIRFRTEKMDLKNGSDGQLLIKPGEKLMEIKVQRAVSLELARALSEAGIKMCSFSKYGNGFMTLKRNEAEEQRREKTWTAYSPQLSRTAL